MSSGLQLDVRYHIQWRRHLVNAYVGALCRLKAVWSMPEHFRVVCIPCTALYKCSDLPFFTCASQHLAQLCVPVADVLGPHNLHSATWALLNFPRYNMTNYGRRAFSYAGPHAWNSLSDHSNQLFKRSLKRFYSGKYRAQRIRNICSMGYIS